MSRETVENAFRTLVRRARRLGLVRGPVRLLWGRAATFPAPRDCASATSASVTVAPRMATAPAARVLGVLAHELAHVGLLQRALAHSESDADHVGAALLGAPIGYDRSDVQRAGTRRPRPHYLPQK